MSLALSLLLSAAQQELNIDGLTQWIGASEGPCIPTGNLLVQENGVTVAKVAFKSAPSWFVAPIYVGNAFGIAENLATTGNFTIAYTAESDFWIQMRSKSHWSGGSQWATKLAAGQNITKTVSWGDTSAWETPLGKPAQTLAQVLTEVQGMVMVGNTNNAVTVFSLKMPGFTPPAHPWSPTPAGPTPAGPTPAGPTPVPGPFSPTPSPPGDCQKKWQVCSDTGTKKCCVGLKCTANQCQ